MSRRIAIFYAATGAGHKAAAEALAETCSTLYPDSRVLLRDVLEYAPGWLRQGTVGSYRAMTRRFTWLWQRIYRDTDDPSGKRPLAFLWNELHRTLSRPYLKYLFEDLDTFDPDAILTTHIFGMSALLDKWEHRTPIYFVGTDYLSHSLQRDPRFDGWFVGSAESARQHRADNIPTSESTILDFGIPIARKYLSPPSRRAARHRLEVEDDRTMVTLVGGGIGAGPLATATESMIDFTDWRIDVLCGNNHALMERLRDRYYPFKHITVQGFVQNPEDYYAASDVVVARPSGLTAAEATACAAAILLIDPLPGQDCANCDYLLEQGAARRIYDCRRAGEKIDELIRTDLLLRMKNRATAIARPNAAEDILAFVMAQMEKRKQRHAPPQEPHDKQENGAAS